MIDVIEETLNVYVHYIIQVHELDVLIVDCHGILGTS